MNKVEEKRTFWFNKYDFVGVAELFYKAIENTVFENARFVFTGDTRTVRGRTEYSPKITQYGFQVVCDVNEHTEIPDHRFVGYAESKGGGWIVYKLAENFDFTQEIVEAIDPKRCDVCGTRRDRTRVMILENNETGELVYVGGSCARNFREVNLENLIWKAIDFEKVFGCLDPDELGFFGGGRRVLDLVESIAVGELLISRLGYVSKKRADIEWKASTADLISCYFAGKGQGYDDVKEVMSRSKLNLGQRVNELTNGGLDAIRARFAGSLARRWNEFDHNMITWLSCKKDVPLGIAAYVAFANVEGSQRAERTDVKTTGFDGADVLKMSDFGWFKVVNIKAKENNYTGDSDFCFTCINEENQKLWFKVGERSKAYRDYEDSTGVWNCGEWESFVNAYDQDVWIELRGKLKSIQEEISFASHIKIKKIEIRTKE